MTPRRALKAGGLGLASCSFLEVVVWAQRNTLRVPVAVSVAVEREIAERASLLIAEGVYMWHWEEGAAA